MLNKSHKYSGFFKMLSIPLFDQAVVSGGNFIQVVLLVRMLGVENFGFFSILYLVVLFFASIAQASINSPMMSIAPKLTQKRRRAFYGSCMVLSIMLPLLFIALSSLAIPFITLPQGINKNDIVLYFFLFALTHSLNEFFRRLLFSDGKAKMGLTIDIVRYSVSLVALYIVGKELNVTTVLLILALANTVSIATAIASSLNITTSLKELIVSMRRIFQSGKWLGAASTLHFFTEYFFVLVSGYLLGMAEVGAMRAAQNLIGVLNPILMALENFIPTNATRKYLENGLKGLNNYLKRMAIIIGAFYILIVLFITIPAKFWITLVFTPELAEYSYVLQAFGVVYLIFFAKNMIGIWFRTKELTINVFHSLVLGALLSFLIAFPLIYAYGIAGAMTGIILTHASILIFMVYKQRVISSNLLNNLTENK